MRVAGAALLIGMLGAGGEVWAGGKVIEGVVNVNTAPEEALRMLPGIGPAKVTAIVAYRQRRVFRTVEELVRIKGVSSKMVKRLRPHLAISGPTTVRVLSAREVREVKQAKEKPPPVAPPPAAVAKVAPRARALTTTAQAREPWSTVNQCLPRP